MFGVSFKVGERVAVYWYDGRFTGAVEKIHANGSLQIVFDNFSYRKSAHPKQCRRLVKKERRRVWLPLKYVDRAPTDTENLTIGIYRSSIPPTNPDWAEFIEVRSKKGK